MYGDTVPHVFVIAGEGWNSGVVGIVASRLTEKYYRPSIVLSIDRKQELRKGLQEVLLVLICLPNYRKMHELLPHFGGHQMAAGMSLAVADVVTLRENLK